MLDKIWGNVEQVKPTRGWSQEEEDYLISNYFDTDMDEIIDHLGRSAGAIYTKACRLRLDGKQVNKSSVWTEEQEQYMRDFYKVMYNATLAKKLNKDRRAVETKAKSMGITK